MKVYVLVIEDRHSDTDVRVFADKDKAIESARKLAQEYCRFVEDYQEKQIADWVFHVEYSCEGDSVTVHEREVDG